jgi:hypothetical protein
LEGEAASHHDFLGLWPISSRDEELKQIEILQVDFFDRLNRAWVTSRKTTDTKSSSAMKRNRKAEGNS